MTESPVQSTVQSTVKGIARLPKRAVRGVKRAVASASRVQQLQNELDAERERITRLEAEIDELRRDSLRIAELTDLVEQRLTPGA